MTQLSNDFASMLASAGVSPNLIPGIVASILGIAAVAFLWSLIWKGVALWQAARNNQNAWFIIFLIVHTLGILEILYLIFWRKNKNNLIHTTVTTHTVTASTPAPDVALSEAPAQPPVSSGTL